MLTAVKLDKQFFFLADKIGNVGADRLLSAEFIIIQLPAAQQLPQFAFNIGEIAAESLSVFKGALLISPLKYPLTRRLRTCGAGTLSLKG
ncbi:MAG: hypothetical protein KGJ06_07320, partial [Pseudomonadota bacterium]|nr:hypothetical protein [Pseudomonadota bacterium]